MTAQSIAILGGGNTAFALAANLTLRGYAITLWEHPSYAASLAPIIARSEIGLDGVAERGVARIQGLTMDIREATVADTLLVPVPSYAHQAFAAQLVPNLRPGHLVVLLPGNLGSLELAGLARAAGRADGVTFAEVDTAPYVCRKTAPNRAHIWGIVTGLGLGAFPARDTSAAIDRLSGVFPGIRPYPHALACGLSATNPIVHPAGVLMNAGRIERSRGEFYFYDEGVTPAVVRAIKAVDVERQDVAAAYGFEADPVEEAYWKGGFGPRGDLWSTINGSQMLTSLRAPGSIETRWLSEDIPYGIATWALLGRQRDVPTPTIDALVALGSVVTGLDCWRTARKPDDLGIAGMAADRLDQYLLTGE
jgi:opine dehydrogenase